MPAARRGQTPGFAPRCGRGTLEAESKSKTCTGDPEHGFGGRKARLLARPGRVVAELPDSSCRVAAKCAQSAVARGRGVTPRPASWRRAAACAWASTPRGLSLAERRRRARPLMRVGLTRRHVVLAEVDGVAANGLEKGDPAGCVASYPLRGPACGGTGCRRRVNSWRPRCAREPPHRPPDPRTIAHTSEQGSASQDPL